MASNPGFRCFGADKNRAVCCPAVLCACAFTGCVKDLASYSPELGNLELSLSHSEIDLMIFTVACGPSKYQNSSFGQFALFALSARVGFAKSMHCRCEIARPAPLQRLAGEELPAQRLYSALRQTID